MNTKKVSIWFGKFPSREAFETYMALEYDEEGDATSQFLTDFHIEYLDEDFQEVSFEEDADVQEALKDFSYAESFIDQLPTIDSEVNAYVLAYYEEYEGVIKASEYMEFIGVFDFIED